MLMDGRQSSTCLVHFPILTCEIGHAVQVDVCITHEPGMSAVGIREAPAGQGS